MQLAPQDTCATTSGHLLTGAGSFPCPVSLWGQGLDLGKELRGARLGPHAPSLWKLCSAPAAGSFRACLPGACQVWFLLPPIALQPIRSLTPQFCSLEPTAGG